MHIHQIPLRNPLRNFMYLLVCSQTKQAIAIDPLDHTLCLKLISEENLELLYVVNTHHHQDHIGGNEPVIAATGATLASHKDAMSVIPNVDKGLEHDDVLTFGKVQLKVMDTPGHTNSHVCLYFLGDELNEPAVFCGDTLFNAGVGRCDLGGAPEIMYKTISQQLKVLPDNVRVFPGHDYIENNLGFTLEYEASNQLASELLERFNTGLNAETFISTIGLEKQINTFFRTDSHEIRKRLNTNDDMSTFVALRHERDSW